MSMLFTNTQLNFFEPDAKTRTTIKGIHVFTANVDPASLATDVSNETAVTRAGVKVGDVVVGFPPASFETDLVFSGCRVAAVDAFLVRISNASSGTVNGSDRTWTFMHFQLS